MNVRLLLVWVEVTKQVEPTFVPANTVLFRLTYVVLLPPFQSTAASVIAGV